MAVGRACKYVYRKMGKASLFLKKIVMLTGLVTAGLGVNSINSVGVRNSLERKFIYLFYLTKKQF